MMQFHSSLRSQYLPVGATGQHLIEELASVIWRKRRVRQADGAANKIGLKESARSAKTLIPAAAPFEAGFSGEDTDRANVHTASEAPTKLSSSEDRNSALSAT